MEVDVLVGVRGLAENIKGEGAIAVAQYVHVQHVDASIDLFLFGPFDVGVQGVYVSEEGVGVGSVDSNKGVIRLAEPEEYRVAMWK